MPLLDTNRKQAKQLVRWHRQCNSSVGEKVRLLERYRHLGDTEILAMPLPLTLAQEIVAVEAGFGNWTALKAAADQVKRPTLPELGAPRLQSVTPILFVREVAAAADFYQSKLGFTLDFLHGKPPFYGAVSRDGVCLHLRFVQEPNFAALAARECGLILATIETSNVKGLYEELQQRGLDFAQPLARQAWGGINFHVRDPDGNTLSFVQYWPPAPDADGRGT